MTTISTTLSNGIELGIGYPSPLTITATGYINTATGYNGAAIYAAAGGPLYLNNQGRIRITQLGGSGVEDGTNTGFSINNSGTISANGDGVYLTHQGPVVNSGTIISDANDAIANRNGGLQITNTSTGLISGYSNGILSRGATITNSGRIVATSVVGNGIDLNGGVSTVSNSGTISGTYGIVTESGGNQTVIDSGKIQGAGGTAIAFGAGDDLLKFTPSASVSIQGRVDGGGGTNTLEFASAASKGTITGVDANFANFTKGTIDSGAYWVFAGSNTIGTGTTLTNAGTLKDTGSLVNRGLIQGPEYSFLLSPGAYLKNVGTITETKATTNFSAAVIGLSGGAAIINNLGTIQNTVGNAGIYLRGGGTITNSGLIEGSTPIYAYNHPITVFNSGTIEGNPAVGLSTALVVPGGYIANTTAQSLMDAQSYGVILFAPGTVVNFGTISAKYLYGIRVQSNSTVINHGTIIGGSNGGTGSASVRLLGNNNHLELYPGAVVTHVATASGSGNVLELGSAASAGTISAIGTSFQGFAKIAVDTGAQWTITGRNSLASSVTLTNSGDLTLAGTLINAGVLNSSSAVTLGTGAYLDNTGKILASSGAGIVASGAAKIVNSGTIDPPGPGVYLMAGGTLINNSAGYIGGGAYGVKINGTASATITNAGTIAGTKGIYVTGAGTAAQTVIDSGSISSISGSTGTAIAFGAGNDLLKLVPSASFGLQGVVDGGGGTDTLEFASAASKGTITGPGTKFVNFTTGTIDSGAYWVFAGRNTITSGTTLTNSGVFVDSGKLTNAGSIIGTGASNGVTLTSGSTFTNLHGASVSFTAPNYGAFAPLIYARGAGASTIINYGTLHRGELGVYLHGGGLVRNGSTADTSATIYSHDAVLTYRGTTSTIVNYGTIVGNYGGAGGAHRGIDLQGNANVYNGSRDSTAALIVGGVGILFGAHAGTLENFGTIIGTYASAPGVLMYYGSGGTVINAGTVIGTNFSIEFNNNSRYGLGSNRLVLYPGSYLNNPATAAGTGNVLELASSASTGTLSHALNTRYLGFQTITVDSGAQWRLTGKSTLASGVTLTDFGTLTNTGSITSPGRFEVFGSLGNSGAITNTTGDGIILTGGHVDNGGSGLISGSVGVYGSAGTAGFVTNHATIAGTSSFGIRLAGGGTIIDGGTIDSGNGTAVSFGGSGANLLVLEKGYQLSGVYGSKAGSNTLELAGSSGAALTVSYNALKLTNFQHVLFGAGGYDTLKIASTAGTLPGTISGFTLTSDVIDLTAIANGTITSQSATEVTVSGTGGTVTIKLDASDATTLGTIRDKSGNGTDIVLQNTVVSETLSTSYSGDENSVVPLGGITVSATPSTGDPLTATLSVSHGIVSAGGSSGATITLSGTAADLNTALAGATYTGDTNYYGPDTLSLVTSDTADGSTASGSATITLSDTTVVSESLSASYSGNENSVVPLGGISVSATPNTIDPLTATLSVSHGTVSADGSSGATITLSGTAAELNTALAGATYTGDTDYYGPDTLSLVTSDTADGSKASGSAAITLSDTTVVSESLSASYSGNENSVVPLGGVTVSATPNTSDPLTATLSVSHGTVSAGGSSGATITLSGTAADLNTALAGATYTGDTNYYGPDTLSLVTSDTADGSTAAGSAAITLADTTVVSDSLPASYSGNENSVVPLGGITVSATPNTSDPLTATLSVSHGTVSAGGSSGATITLSGTAAALNTALAGATYTGDINYYGPDTLSLTTSDSVNGSTASGSATITLSDTTVVSESLGGPYSGNENSVVPLGGITVSASPNTTDPLTVTLSVLHGKVSAGGSSGATITLSGTAATLDTALAGAAYSGAANYYGPDTLSLVTSDTVNGSTASGSATITLADTTVVGESLSASYSGNENSVVPLGGISVSAVPNATDPLTVTLSVGHGTVSVGGTTGATITLSGTAATLNTALAGATYTGSTNYYGTDTLSLTTSDTADGSTANRSATITLSDTTVASGSLSASYSGNENSVVPLGGITISAAPNTGDPLTATLSVSHGTVSAGGTSGATITLSGNAATLNTALAGAAYTGSANFYGSDTLSLVTSDTADGSKTSGAATITLSDTTVVSERLSGPYGGNENSVVPLGGITISATPNTNDPLTTTLSVSHGTVSAGGTSGASITLSGTAAALNTALAGATYTGSANYYGPDTLSLVTTDTADGNTASGSAAIALSDTTVVSESLPASYSVNENSVVPLGGITVSASPNAGDPLTTTLSVLHGTVSAGGTSGASITLSGTAASLNTALAGAAYTVAANYFGPDTLSLTTSDTVDGNTATGSAAITVLAASSPTITGTASGLKTISQAPLAPFSGVTIADPSSGATETLTITLSGGGGLLTGPGLISNPGGTYTLTGPANTVTSNLDALSFTPTGGALNTATTTGFTLSDQSSTNVPPVSDSSTSVIDYNPAFGWMVITDPTTPVGELYTFYEDILGRAPDPSGFVHWVTALQDSESLEGIMLDFLKSPEYTAKFGAYTQGSDVTFLDNIYQSVLHRLPDPSGLQTYGTALASGLSREDVALSILTSQESRADLKPVFDAGVFVPDPQAGLFGSVVFSTAAPEGAVYALYQGILGRAPDPLGFENYTTALAAGASLASLAQDLLDSSEYTAHFGANAENSNAIFLTDLYQAALHRPPDAGGLQSYESELATGTSRAEIAVQISLSPEAQANLQPAFEFGVLAPDATDASIARLYYGILDRAPDAAGLSTWESAAAAGAPLVTIAADFLASPEYLGNHAGQSDTQFVEALYENALGRAPGTGELQNFLSQLANPQTQTFDFNSIATTPSPAGTIPPALTPQLADRAFVAVSIAESPEAQLHLLPLIENGLKLF